MQSQTPCIIGESWLAVEQMASELSGFTTSQAQPLPKRVVAALLNCSWKEWNPPKASSIALASLPWGVPPPFGERMVQKKVWLEWPPPLLRTAVWIDAGSFEMSLIRSLTF